MAFSKIIQYGNDKNFLESETGLVLKTFTGEQTNATAEVGRKYIKGGSVFPTNKTGAKGIVYESVDMTDDEKRPISVIVAGRVYENRLPVSVDETAKTELAAQGIVFVTAPETEF